MPSTGGSQATRDASHATRSAASLQTIASLDAHGQEQLGFVAGSTGRQLDQQRFKRWTLIAIDVFEQSAGGNNWLLGPFKGEGFDRSRRDQRHGTGHPHATQRHQH